MGAENWENLRFVLALYKHGTLELAARALKVDPSTVRRRLEAFEAWLGDRAFARERGRYTPTPLGLRVIDRLEEIDAQLDPIRQQAAGIGTDLESAIRVTAVPTIVQRALLPALPAFLRRHRSITVELIAEPSALSIARREADIAVRLARPTSDAEALTRKLGTLTYGVYCRADLAPNERALPWIGHDESRVNIPQARWIGRQAREEVGPMPLLTNDAEVSLQGVLDGIGKTLIADPVGRRLDALARIDRYAVDIEREVWSLVHPAYRTLPRVRHTLAWVQETLEAFLAR